eukprot:m.339702 g.339702  ORF g.339702 m.339702 type:complete len:295 (-) comp18921_c0_seq1:61-945(-)
MALWDVLKRAGKRALGGGIPGAIAMVLQVVLLMWLRTTMNYMYRNGGTMTEAFETLYSEGGVGRFYQGIGPALIQGPLSRFGDTAANEGIKSLFSGTQLAELAFWGPLLVTVAASMSAGVWRVFIAPVDTVKTFMQVEGGTKGLQVLSEKIQANGFMVLYSGALGSWAATAIGHFPWFYTYNFLDKSLPKIRFKLVRNAFIGLCASFVSDCVSNSVRVVKTVIQTSAEPLTYFQAIEQVLEKGGIYDLLFRGLSVKIISNGLSSILFTILWKYLMELYANREKSKEKDEKDKKQ